MQGFLDLYMMKAAHFTPEDIAYLRQQFITALNGAIEIYGDKVFRPFNPEENEWESRPHKAFHDAVMIGVAENIDRMVDFPRYKERIVNNTAELFRTYPNGTFTGRGNTKADVQERIRVFSEMLASALRR